MKLERPDYVKNIPVNYFGNKTYLMDYILAVIPKSTKVFIDLFGGTMAVGYSVKKMLGAKVIANDILRYSALKGRVFIANNKTLLSDADIKMLTSVNQAGDSATELYGHILGKNNALFIDNWISNIPQLSNPIKKDIAALIPILCVNKCFSFAATHFTSHGMPTGGMQCWEKNIEAETVTFAKTILPQLVCDNGKTNQIYNEDSVGLVSKVKGDVLYFDSPYCAWGKGGTYESNYSFFDDLVSVMTNKAHEIENRYDGKADLPAYQDFTNRSSSLLGFAEIFKRARHIPLVIASYNTTSYVAIEEIENIAITYGRNVESQYIDYYRPKTNKDNGSETKEVLIVCWNKGDKRPDIPAIKKRRKPPKQKGGASANSKQQR